jgi:hypothetical protein
MNKQAWTLWADGIADIGSTFPGKTVSSRRRVMDSRRAAKAPRIALPISREARRRIARCPLDVRTRPRRGAQHRHALARRG